MKEIEYILPEYWASYLMNGDSSGLSQEEETNIELWLKLHNNPNIIDVKDDAHFRYDGSWDAPNELGGDYCTYIALIDE